MKSTESHELLEQKNKVIKEITARWERPKISRRAGPRQQRLPHVSKPPTQAPTTANHKNPESPAICENLFKPGRDMKSMKSPGDLWKCISNLLKIYENLFNIHGITREKHEIYENLLNSCQPRSSRHFKEATPRRQRPPYVSDSPTLE